MRIGTPEDAMTNHDGLCIFFIIDHGNACFLKRRND
jgi:hypothetical protein